MHNSAYNFIVSVVIRLVLYWCGTYTEIYVYGWKLCAFTIVGGPVSRNCLAVLGITARGGATQIVDIGLNFRTVCHT